jgi:tRNA 2-thiocytidine biosynthesis protein TtcA
LCGSQENLQRVAVKNMLQGWEQEFPGRTESIASALRNVELEHLGDPRHFDFGGLDARRTAPMSEREEEELAETLGALAPRCETALP